MMAFRSKEKVGKLVKTNIHAQDVVPIMAQILVEQNKLDQVLGWLHEELGWLIADCRGVCRAVKLAVAFHIELGGEAEA